MPAEPTNFKSELLNAVSTAEQSGELGRLQARRIRLAANNPRKLARIQAEAVAAAYDSNPTALKIGKDGQVDWGKLFANFEKWLPKILQLFSLFGG